MGEFEHAVPTIVLASSSPYRRAQLRQLGLAFQAVSPEVDETPGPREAPDALAERLAVAKARVVAADYPHAWVIGSDQVAARNGMLLGKPGSVAAAERQLLDCSGQWVEFSTGLCLHHEALRKTHVTVVPYRVCFRVLREAQVRQYVARDRPLDCAGAFKSEGLGVALLQQMEGPDPSALVGLPLIALCGLLANEGIDVLSPPAGRP